MTEPTCFEGPSSDECIPEIIEECGRITGYNVEQAKACIRAAIRKAQKGECTFCRQEVVAELELALKHLG